MNINKEMDEEDVLHIYNGILAIKKNKIMPSAATWMHQETVILKKIRHRKINII